MAVGPAGLWLMPCRLEGEEGEGRRGRAGIIKWLLLITLHCHIINVLLVGVVTLLVGVVSLLLMSVDVLLVGVVTPNRWSIRVPNTVIHPIGQATCCLGET